MTFSELRSTCKRNSDYIITLFITNELSLMLTWFLLNRRISPNQITAYSMLSALVCGVFYAYSQFLAGSFFLFASHILDCTDGNLARARSQFSNLGKWLDMISDRLSEFFVFFGTMLFFLRSSEPVFWSILSLTDIALLSVYYYIVDISLALKLSQPIQTISGMQFKGVNVKWGLMEPIIYGFIILSPFGLVKLHLVLVFLLIVFGISFQFYKFIKADLTQ